MCVNYIILHVSKILATRLGESWTHHLLFKLEFAIYFTKYNSQHNALVGLTFWLGLIKIFIVENIYTVYIISLATNNTDLV
jgi:hypothetical protein